METLVLRAKNVMHDYGSGETETHALRGVSLDLPPAKVTLVMGPSGCGKTTLLAILSGLLHPTGGTVLMGNKDLYALSPGERRDWRLKHLGIIFQGYNLFPTLTVNEQLELVLRWGHLVSPNEAARRTRELLEVLDLPRKARLMPNELSGGEKQRVAIGRALIKDPDFLFADEPTSALDWEHGKQVLDILVQAARKGAMVLLVSHDPRVIDYADHVYHLDDGLITEKLK